GRRARQGPLTPEGAIVRIRRTRSPEETDLHRTMERMMERLLVGTEAGLSSRGWVPRADVHETSEGVVVTLEIAGGRRDAIEILAEGTYLRVSGVREEPAPGACVRWRQMEIAYGPFERVIGVPFEIDPDAIRATYEDGYLRIEID